MSDKNDTDFVKKNHRSWSWSILEKIILTGLTLSMTWIMSSVIMLRESVVELKGTVAGLSTTARINSDRILAQESFAGDLKEIKAKQDAVKELLLMLKDQLNEHMKVK